MNWPQGVWLHRTGELNHRVSSTEVPVVTSGATEGR